MLIALTQGQFAEVDEADADRVRGVKWHAVKCGDKWYAKCNRDGKKLPMQNFILDIASSSNLVIDHINGDGLDNQRSNLRIATWAENSRNRQNIKRNGFIGVKQVGQRWRAFIWHKKFWHIGYFNNAEDAAKARDAKARQLFGQFATLNFV